MRAIARSALSSRHLSPRLARSSLPFRPSLCNSSTMSAAPIDGIVLGVSGGKPANADVARATSIDIASQWAASRVSNTKPGQLRVFYPSKPDEPIVAAVSLASDQKPAPTTAPDTLPAAETYLRNENLEWSRIAAAKGAKALKEHGHPSSSSSSSEGGDDKAKLTKRTIAVDSFASAHAAATGANLGLWQVNHFKTRGPNAAFGEAYEKQGGRDIEVVPLSGGRTRADKEKILDQGDEIKGSSVPLSFFTGEVYAEAQNWARELMETPANLLTPTIFSNVVTERLNKLANVKTTVHDEAWAKSKGMGSFLSVANGTEEPAKMLEIHYKGATSPNAPTLAFVGKGITFDSGGISLKPGLGMKLMRADMGGAAVCVSTVYAIAKLGIPVNLVCVTALTENMPSGHATKPGDIVKAMNGLTIEVDNTDAEGRLVLADALTYVSREFKPAVLIDVATLTGAILHALGHEYTGAFVEDESLWQGIKACGEAEDDPFWRMPLSDRFEKYVDTSNSDIVNVGRPAGSASAAIFLKQFVEGLEDRSKQQKATVKYAHLDIAGTMEKIHNTAYQTTILTGRPTRALIEYARRFAVAP